MKTFLVPTDFSAAAKTAVNYAVEMAKAAGAKLILFHAYHIPPVVADAALIIPSPVELEEDNMRSLQEIRAEILGQAGNTELKIECICSYGFAVDEIIRYTEEGKADLVIMGMQGAGWLSEKFFGSITTAVMKQCTCPVLSIGRGQQFQVPKKIVFAYDYEQVQPAVLEPFLVLAELFQSRVFVLNVSRNREQTDAHIRDTFKNVQLDAILEETDHTFHYRTNEDLIDAIDRFVQRHQAQMVVMIARQHSFITNLFKEPFTRQAAFRLHVPMLSLHE